MDFKDKVIQATLSTIDERIAFARAEMEAAQASANEETKSTAGDKYETGRAMSQNERDLHAQKVSQLLKTKQALMSMDFESYNSVQIGSLVETDSMIYLISAGLGMIEVENRNVAVISSASPIGKVLMGKKTGDLISGPQRTEKVLSIH